MLSAALRFPDRRLHVLARTGAIFTLDGRDQPLLTFDDGPDPHRTPAVLELLEHAGLRAAFFLIGRRAQRHPQLVRRIAQAGHEVGAHAWSHRFLARLQTAEIAEEIDRTVRTLDDLVGGPTRWIRPPFGWADARFYELIDERRLRAMLWSVDSLDYAGAPASFISWRLRAAGPGDIVLLHDGSPLAHGTLGALKSWTHAREARAVREGVT